MMVGTTALPITAVSRIVYWRSSIMWLVRPNKAEIDHWDADGAGSTFKKYYAKYYDLAVSYGLDAALKPTKLDISETVRWLGYTPSYSLASLLSELAAYGDSGPPRRT